MIESFSYISLFTVSGSKLGNIITSAENMEIKTEPDVAKLKCSKDWFDLVLSLN